MGKSHMLTEFVTQDDPFATKTLVNNKEFPVNQPVSKIEAPGIGLYTAWPFSLGKAQAPPGCIFRHITTVSITREQAEHSNFRPVST